MIIILSPAKTLRETLNNTLLSTGYNYSIPEFINESFELIKCLRRKTPEELSQLMTLSKKLANLNFQRYQNFHLPFTTKNALQAILTFRGDAYEEIEVENYNKNDFNFAQKHLRIISGLYGLLRPLDLIQPYRLEMGTRLPNPLGKNLYEFWGNKITQNLNSSIHEQKAPLFINLASQEYFKAIYESKLNGKLINIIFKEKINDEFKTIGLFAKRARGKMVNFIIKNRIETAHGLTHFTENGYQFNCDFSDKRNYIFIKKLNPV